MTGTIKVNTIRNESDSINLPVSYLQHRMVQKTTRRFSGGLWNPGNTYYEIPGSLLNITPLYSNSYLVYSYSGPMGHVWNAHSITHWIFYVNGREHARHSRSGDHYEGNHIMRWEVPSWGAGVSGTMGYFARQYSSGSHGTHFNGRRYENGANINDGVAAYISVEEYIGP